MAEDQVGTEGAAQESNEAAEPNTEGTETPQLGDAGKKAIQAEREARKAAEKAASEAAAKLKEYEDANKTELEKAQAAATEAQEQLAALRQDALRNQIALDDGLDADLAALLHGSEEEMRAQARVFKERLNSQPKTPRPDPSQGAKGKASAGSTADQFAEFFNNSLTNS